MFLEFVEGPLWWLASAVFVIGVSVRLIDIFRRGSKADLAPPNGDAFEGAIMTIIRRSWVAKGFSKGATFHLVAGYMFHIGLFVLLLFAAPHVLFIQQQLLGFAWTPAPHWLFIVAAELAFAGLLLLWLRRMLHPVMRQISTFDDHAAALLTFIAMLTGCMALLQAHDSLRAVHMLAVELLMIYFPFSRLMHAFTFGISRAYTGAAMGRKGVKA
jgi:nitrate reductase gamma subunit